MVRKRLPVVTGCLALAASALLNVGVSAEEWSLEPLGATVERTAPGIAPIRQELNTRYRKDAVEGVPTILFQEAGASCAIIIPDHASETEKQASELLQSTLEKMTGGPFTIYSEGAIRVSKDDTGKDYIHTSEGKDWEYAIWIGQTLAAKKAGVSASDLIPEGYRLKTEGHHLFVVGHDHPPMGTPRTEARGTYIAASSLLERHLGVRWLWPGEIGTVIPKRSMVELPPLNEQDEPMIRQRNIRNLDSTIPEVVERTAKGIELLGGEPAHLDKLYESNQQWLLNQKCGSSVRLAASHAYGNWWTKYGTAHPDWFALQPDGNRVQSQVRPDRARLCKSNPAVALQVAKQVNEAYAADPKRFSVSISPNDGGPSSFCMCSECRKLDPSNGELISLWFFKNGKRFDANYVSLSNRLVTFYNRIAEEVAKTNPNARLGAYAYSAYREPPLGGVRLHPSITIGFVGLSYYDEAMRKQDLERWDGWSNSTSEMLLRPNILLGGEGVPSVYVHRLGADIKHCYQTGMIAADFDYLTGHWGTQGLNYYVLAKLLWDPSQDVDAIVKDYCDSGFGSAADKIGEYFAALEKANFEIAMKGEKAIDDQLREEEQDLDLSGKKSNKRKQANAKKKIGFKEKYVAVFGDKFLKELRSILQDAKKAAGDDKMIHQRIAFLESGLDYASLHRDVVAGKDQLQAKQRLLGWYRNILLNTQAPYPVNPINRLYHTQVQIFSDLK